jgi:hypothetical protein
MIAAFFSYRRENYYPIMLMTIVAAVIGASVGFSLLNVMLGEVMMFNIVAMIAMLIYRDHFTEKGK